MISLGYTNQAKMEINFYEIRTWSTYQQNLFSIVRCCVNLAHKLPCVVFRLKRMMCSKNRKGPSPIEKEKLWINSHWISVKKVFKSCSHLETLFFLGVGEDDTYLACTLNRACNALLTSKVWNCNYKLETTIFHTIFVIMGNCCLRVIGLDGFSCLRFRLQMAVCERDPNGFYRIM